MFKVVLYYASITVLASVTASTVFAGIGTQAIKQAAKAATKVIAGDVAEQGGKAAVRNVIKQASDDIAKHTGKSATSSVLSKGSALDEVADAAWRNKGTLAGAAVLGTVVTNPEAAIAASADVVEAGIVASAEYVAEPIAQRAAEPLAGLLWLLVMLIPVSMLGAYLHFRDKKPKAGS